MAKKKMSLLSLSIPIFIETGLLTFMGSASTFMLGHYSSSAVAGVSVSAQIMLMVLIMYGFVNGGTGVLVAQAMGAGQRGKALEVTVVSLAMNLVFGLLLSGLMFFCGPFLLHAIGLPPDAFPYAVSYLRIAGAASFLDALVMVIASTLRSLSFTRDAMYVNVVLNILNVIGCYLVLFHPFSLPSYGVQGVAAVYAAVQLVGGIVMFIVLKWRIKTKLPFGALKKMPLTTMKNILTIGLPSAGENLSWAASQVAITSLIAGLGSDVIAAKTYTESLIWYINILTSAIAQGTQIMVGHLIGAKREEEAYKLCVRSHRISFVCAFVSSGLMWMFCHQIFGWFTSNETVIALSSTLMPLTLILEPGRTLNVVYITSLVAAGDAKFPLFMGLIFMWGIALGLSWLLGVHFAWGLTGVFIAYCADEWVRGVLMFWRWRSRKWLGKAMIQVESAPQVSA